jgi:hypothetical protein
MTPFTIRLSRLNEPRSMGNLSPPGEPTSSLVASLGARFWLRGQVVGRQVLPRGAEVCSILRGEGVFNACCLVGIDSCDGVI